MARVAAILRALWQAFRRDQKSFQSIAGNNFFLVTALLLQRAGGFLLLIMGLVMLFPLSTDPLRKIPASRMVLWPLDRRDRWMLRMVSPWLNPVSWIVVGLAIWAARGKVTLGLWGLVAVLFAVGFLFSDVRLFSTESLWRLVPNFPGLLNQLVRKNVRELLSTLDFYCALVLSLCVLAYRILGPPLPPEAFLAITVLVVLALSSYAQCLFGLDGDGGLGRYRLLPLRGWQILAAKDAAFLVVVLPLTLPLAPLPGMAAALAALAIGHEPSVRAPRDQTRWRFSTGASLTFGLFQAAMMGMAASGVFFSSPLVLLLCVAVWLGSLWYYGKEIDRVPVE
ncbi:MAG TPA: hypothetical protein VKU19_03135 [Bryobacteraceae bacterium]|nr:hypothetical protein [Bryobacteraceae bacterium]